MAAAARHNPTSSKDLKDQALYVTEPQRQVKDHRKEASWPLDANGKLTSAGAATSLKRADAKDLPSFPSVGIASSAAGGAALLANQNQKSFEWWKPEASAGASKAAMLAKDYKMDPLWQPEATSAGSKAALLAHQKGHGAHFWEPTASDKALIAATGAVAGKTGRPKVSETGLADRYPDEKNAAKNALSAATSVHSNSAKGRNLDLIGLTDEEAAKIRQQAIVSGMSADLFGSTPLIGPELEERKHQAGLHAAAVSMAQGMYGKRDKAYRDKMDAARAGSKAAARGSLDDDSDQEDTPMSFVGLQETAQKLANERLAKLQDPDEAYRKHWGTSSPPPKNRLSMFGGSRRRSNSDSSADEDEKDSRRIRGEMTLFKDKLKEIDERKRKDDRQALLAAAQRKVRKDMDNLDEDVFQRTGKMSPAMRAEWEAKARAKAQAESENRKSNYGKVALGGGKYLDQTEIDAIAQSRLQPTLDAITAKAEHDREVDEQLREEEEERKRVERMNKEVEKEKDRRIKAEWKLFKSEEKAEKKEQSAREKEEKRKSKQATKDAKMQEKFDKTIEKEEEEAIEYEEKEAEKEAKEAEKEHDKQVKAEWKLFKRQEKKREHDEKAAQKEEKAAQKEKEKEEKAAQKEKEKEKEEADKSPKKENRLSTIFRRKSRKDKDRDSKHEDMEQDKPIPTGRGTIVTTITGGAAAGAVAGTAAAAEEDVSRSSSLSEDVPSHHEEPHHNPLTAVEETPEARAANQQKPGGDLLQMFRRKKQEHDEKKQNKRRSVDEAALSQTNGSTVVGKDEPGKTPAPEAIAPEHTKEEEISKEQTSNNDASASAAAIGGAAAGVAVAGTAAEFSKYEDDEQQTRPLSQPHAMHSLILSQEEHTPAVAEEEATVAPVEVAATSTTPAPAPAPAQVPVSTPAPAVTSTKGETTSTIVPKKEQSVPKEEPAPVTPVEPTTPKSAKQESPKAVKTSRSPALAKAQKKTVERIESSSDTIPGTRYGSGRDERSSRVSAVSTTKPTAEPSSAVGDETITAIGSDRPVSTEIRRSSILDKIEPRVNAGKPGFEGSTKFASWTADMRGTDHAGTDYKEHPDASDAPGAEAELTQNATAQSAEAASPKEGTTSGRPKGASISRSAEGQKHEESVASRIGIASTAQAAAEDAVNQQGSHGTPRAKESKERTHRLSGFFRSKFGAAGKKFIKEHKGSDGVVVSPTTQSTTHGKYVDPADKHSKTVDAPTPANKELLDGEGEASGIAVDPAYQAEEEEDQHEQHEPVSPLSEEDEQPTTGGAGYRGRKTELSEEARDTVDTEGLPLPKLPAASGFTRGSESPVRETRFKEQI